MTNPEDPDEALGEWAEQFAALINFTGALYAFYRANLQQGFNEDQAMQLTCMMLNKVLEMHLGGEVKNDAEESG